MQHKVLVIDDEAAIRDSLKMILEYDGYDCLLAPSGQTGLARIERDDPDVVLLDVRMPGMDGQEVLRKIRMLDELLPVIIISGHGTVSTAVEVTKLGAFDFLEKPLSTERVKLTIRNALSHRQLDSENRKLGAENRKLDAENRSWRRAAELRHEMIGESPALRVMTDEILRAAPARSAVLIQGESGVGKELVARAIHRHSRRARERFVQVNCAAIPDDLIESELFGHEKGSFTGATEKQIGKFEQADRGTIFLDEVGDMSLRTQAKVLRVLQEGEVERLGSARTIRVDVRVLAATNKDLAQAIEAGDFREDLYFRLSVIPIHVPPLRERPGDVPLLVQHFATLLARESNFRPRPFTDEAIEALASYRWRGNVRELRNSVERLMVMTPGGSITLADVRSALRLDDRPALGGAVSPPAARTLREFKETSERAFLVAKLRDLDWNISRTAEEIDTPRSNLYKKLEQYRISQETDG